MPSDGVEDVRAIPASLQFGPDQARDEFGFSDDPCRIDALIAEVGVLASNTFAPGSQPLGFKLDEQYATSSCDPKTRLKGMHEREINLTKMNCLYPKHSKGS